MRYDNKEICNMMFSGGAFGLMAGMGLLGLLYPQLSQAQDGVKASVILGSMMLSASCGAMAGRVVAMCLECRGAGQEERVATLPRASVSVVETRSQSRSHVRHVFMDNPMASAVDAYEAGRG